MSTIIKKITFNEKGELCATYSPDGEEIVSISKVSGNHLQSLRKAFSMLDLAFTQYLAPTFNLEVTGIARKKKDDTIYYKIMFSANINGISCGVATEWLFGKEKHADDYSAFNDPEDVKSAHDRHNFLIHNIQIVESEFLQFLSKYNHEPTKQAIIQFDRHLPVEDEIS